MRVLHVVRPNAHERPGGDLVHAQGTGGALRALGVAVDLVASDAPDPTGYDVAHVFGIFEPGTARRQIAAIRTRAVPLALSPIWLDLRPYFATAPLVERALRARTARGVERGLRAMRGLSAERAVRGNVARAADRRLERQRELVLQADVLLPASEVEAYLYGERLRVLSIPSVVAPLGTEDAGVTPEDAPPRSGVLCVGRVESKKNQAALLYALRDLDVDVTVLGREHDPAYSALCRRWATKRTRFVAAVPHETVYGWMRGAAVHAHPSWCETPGLASLEAARAGARVVVGDRGCEREYFGPDVDYADPAEPDSIRVAVERALACGPRKAGDTLEKRLRAFTWRRHGEATLAAYERVCRG